MEIVLPLLAACICGFLLVLYLLFNNTIGGKKLNLDFIKQFLIVINLSVWVYEFFFLIAVCGLVKGMNVFFGEGLGDLLYFFLLVGTVLLHIGLLALSAYNNTRTIYFVLLVFLPIYPMVIMHQAAARGNETNGYMLGGNLVGLYVDMETRNELRKSIKPVEYDPAAEFRSLLYKAKHGDVVAQYELGMCYAYGHDVEKNDSLAIKWWCCAAEGGYTPSQMTLGKCYYNGSNGLNVDYQAAAAWFLKAAKNKDTEAQYLIGCCYYNGEGVEQNDEEAFKWLRRAAKKGHRDAQNLLRDNRRFFGIDLPSE